MVMEAWTVTEETQKGGNTLPQKHLHSYNLPASDGFCGQYCESWGTDPKQNWEFG